MKTNNGFYCCHWCNKKYKRIEKLSKHVEEFHPFMTIGANDCKLSIEDKMWILDAFEAYVALLADYSEITGNYDSSFDQATSKLNMTHEAHILFQKRAIESGLLEKSISDNEQLLRLLNEFEMFLNLGRTWRDDNFCPSLIIDLIWHSAMMNSENYAILCNRFLGKVLPHCLAENDETQVTRFEQFVKQFEHYHKKTYIKVSDLILGTDDAIRDIKLLLLEKKAKEDSERIIAKIQQQQIEQEIIQQRINQQKEQVVIYQQQKQQRLQQQKEQERLYQDRIQQIPPLTQQTQQTPQIPYDVRSIWDDGKC